MNRKLIFQLSLFGLAMAFASVFWIPTAVEPFFWVVIFLFCAYMIAKKCSGKYFLHGFLVSIVNSVWITAVHIIFYDKYIANHPDILEMNAKMPLQDYPRLLMLIMGPIFGALSGLVLGLFAFFENKILKFKTNE